MSAWAWGARLSLEVHMQGLLQEQRGKQVTDVQHDLVQAGEERLRPGYSLPGEARPWLNLWRLWAHCRKRRAVFMGCDGLPANSSRHSLPEGGNGHHMNHSQPGLVTTESLTLSTAMMEVAGTSGV